MRTLSLGAEGLVVDENGSLNNSVYGGYSCNSAIAVRPALWLNLESVIF